MKYYHIIYNSSEKRMDGGVGFGIRTATDGTPQALLQAIKNCNFFSDDWETYDRKPTPAQMKENPASIESVAKNYAVTTLADETGKIYNIIARRAYVGFDYGFYKNGLPTRPGNYVVDYYVFEQTPDCSAYEILYENALEGSNHFIPESVQPTETNEEMREISIGAQPPLPVSDKPFTANKADALDPDVVKLFFHYFQAKNARKQLVVKAAPEKALKLTADLYRMLEPESAKSVRTYINMRNQGTNESFDIFFIHNDYPHQIYDGLYSYIEIDSASLPSTDEAKTFGAELQAYVSDSFSANKGDIDDTLKWLMLPEYQTVKLMSKRTNDSFFCYCIQPGNFMYENLMDADGKQLNEEFLKVLCAYVNKTPQNAERFNLIVAETMNEATAQNVIDRIKEYNRLAAIGFKLDSITPQVKDHVCSVLLSDINLLKQALDTVGLNGLEKFFVKPIFEEHADYVDSNVLDPYMPQLYKLFLPETELKAKNNMLYNRFYKRDMNRAEFFKIVDDVHSTAVDKKIEFFCQVLQKELKPFKTVWPDLQHYLNQSSKTPDFLEVFKERIGNGEYAPMFYYSIAKNKAEYTNIDKFRELTEKMKLNPELKKLVDKDERLSTMTDYLTLVDTGNLAYVAGFSADRMEKLFGEIIRQNNLNLFNALLPLRLQMSKKRSIDPVRIARDYCKIHNDPEPIDAIEVLDPSHKWIDMLAAVIADTYKLPFDKALLLCEDLNLKNKVQEELLTRCYAKEYKAWKRKMRIKRFFKSLLKPFKHTKKKKITHA